MTDVHPAHQEAPDENPMDHVGEPIPDPWDDLDQDDWTTGSADHGE